MMVRIPYVTVSGELRVYEYAPPDRIFRTAADRCLKSMTASGGLFLVGKGRWQSGPRGCVFNGATVAQLILRGAAVRTGDMVRLA